MARENKKQKVFIVGPTIGHDNASNYINMFNTSAGYSLVNNPKYADILCFLGGSDVNPKLYGEEKSLKTYCSPAADELDIKFFDKFPNKNKVGICRGGQFLNVMSEGEMWQDVNNHHGGHKVINLLEIPDTHWKMGTKLEVTSDHHQMMRSHPEYGEILCIASQSSKFISPSNKVAPQYDTEVVWYEHTKSLCFQPHPEWVFMYQTRAYFFSLMHYLMG